MNRWKRPKAQCLAGFPARQRTLAGPKLTRLEMIHVNNKEIMIRWLVPRNFTLPMPP